MAKADAFFRKLGDYADLLVYILGGGGLLLSVGMCAYNILTWWFMGSRVASCDEISLIGLVWASYIGMGLLFRNNSHCTMSFVVNLLPPNGRKAMRILTDVMILVISCIAVYYSWKLSIRSFSKKLILTRIPYFYCDICVTIGYAHLLCLAVADIVRNAAGLLGRKKGGAQ